MNVLITGGTGFIGSRLALTCWQRGDSVVVLGQENNPAESQNRTLVEAAGAKVILASVMERERLFELLQGIDCVYHLAAAQHEANVPDQRFWDVNVTGTRNVLEASVNAGVKRVVHGSTIGVYGLPANGPINENSPLTPDNIYGVTKLEGERVVLSFAEKIPIVIIRISETYGPGDRRLLKLFRAIEKKAFFLIGTGQNVHHPIFINDLIEGFLLAASAEAAPGRIFVLTGREALTTKDMVNGIATEVDSRIPRLRAPLPAFLLAAVALENLCRPLGIQPPLHRRRLDFFRKSFTFSCKDAFQYCGFRPKHTFESGVRETAKWYRQMGYLQSRPHQPTSSESTVPGSTISPTNLVHDNPGPFQEIDHRPENMGHAHAEGWKVKTEVEPQTRLTAKVEPFDSFWEGPEDVEKGYRSFSKFYKHNYLKHIPERRDSRILVISCGPGYFVNLLRQEGYSRVLGIDSYPAKIEHAIRMGLNCIVGHAFDFLEKNLEPFDVIFAEQEINHLTKDEILRFLQLCWNNLTDGGTLILHSLNGANPITGAEALAQNFDHYNTFTEYSLRQILEYSIFHDVKVIPLNLYVFYKNPLNYVAIVWDWINTCIFRLNFKLYGKFNRIFTKKIGAVCKKRLL